MLPGECSGISAPAGSFLVQVLWLHRGPWESMCEHPHSRTHRKHTWASLPAGGGPEKPVCGSPSLWCLIHSLFRAAAVLRKEALAPASRGHVRARSGQCQAPAGLGQAFTWRLAAMQPIVLLGHCGFSNWRERLYKELLKFEPAVYPISDGFISPCLIKVKTMGSFCQR